MSRGKYLSLEEARKADQLKQFAKEHPSQADSRFPKLLDAMARGTLEAGGTSDPETSEDYSGTRTRPGTSGDTSGLMCFRFTFDT